MHLLLASGLFAMLQVLEANDVAMLRRRAVVAIGQMDAREIEEAEWAVVAESVMEQIECERENFEKWLGVKVNVRYRWYG